LHKGARCGVPLLLISRPGFGVFKNIQAAGEENKPVKVKLKIRSKK